MNKKRLALVRPARGLRRLARIDIKRAHEAALERRRLVAIARS